MCLALVVFTGITAACFCLGWCSRQHGQVRISLLICSDMPGQNHLSLALWIGLGIDGLGAAFGVNTHPFSAAPGSFGSSQWSHQWLQCRVCNPSKLWPTRALDCSVLVILPDIGALAPGRLDLSFELIGSSVCQIHLPQRPQISQFGWSLGILVLGWVLVAAHTLRGSWICASQHPSCIWLWNRSLDIAAKVVAAGWSSLLSLS